MSFIDWSFDNRVVRELPGDPSESRAPRQVRSAAWSPVVPEPVPGPELRAWSPEVAELVGLGREAPAGIADVLTGNRLLEGMHPYAAVYGGHQFGHWAGQLGDGRAITLGEAIGAAGVRYDMQLKGAGRTPYSRGADGRAVLRSSIREFLCSEAMHHLGVPTTRALSLCTTGEDVVRDMFYDGRARPEPGAIVCRVAPTFLRLGTYQIFAARDDVDTLRAVVRFTLRHHFPHLAPTHDGDDGAVIQWATEVAQRSADLVVHWHRVGFVHGVLNTDNLSVLGLTLDYGPYGWLDHFDPDFTPNTTDEPRRRYRFGHQPSVVAWNLARFLEALAPLVDDHEALQGVLDRYTASFGPAFLAMMRSKLGLEREHPDDADLIDELFGLMGRAEVDMTLLFRHLADVPVDEEASPIARLRPLRRAFYDPDAPTGPLESAWHAWLERYAARAREEGAGRRERMNQVNPRFILRNYLVQQAITQAEAGDFSEVHRLQALAREPYAEHPDAPAHYFGKRPEWARNEPGCSMLSCSS